MITVLLAHAVAACAAPALVRRFGRSALAGLALVPAAGLLWVLLALDDVGRDAAVTADGPGMGTTRTPASAAARTSAEPGSLTDGMPASVTTATLSPSVSQATTRAISCGPACASNDVSGFRSTPRWVRSVRVRRVSSATTRSTLRSVSAARAVMSSRLPMGVPTT